MRFSSACLLLAVATLGGCDDDDIAEPTVDEVVGEYLAIQFTATAESGTVDMIEEGAGVLIVLHDDGTTTGILSIPEGVPGGPLEVDLDGLWAVDGTSIDLDNATLLAGGRYRWRGDGLIEGTIESDADYEIRFARIETGPVVIRRVPGAPSGG